MAFSFLLEYVGLCPHWNGSSSHNSQDDSDDHSGYAEE